MATAKKIEQAESTASINSVLYDKVWEFPKGKIRLTIDLKNVLERMERYKDQLVYSRDLPFNPDSIDIGDPLVQWIAENMSWIASDKVKPTAISHYHKMHNSTETDAFILAVTVDNTLENAPLPYDEEPNKEEIPGIVTMPTYKRNVEHPVEARLKQVMDIMASDLGNAMKLMTTLESAMVRIKQMGAKSDPDGFPR